MGARVSHLSMVGLLSLGESVIAVHVPLVWKLVDGARLCSVFVCRA
jgi:hypothetical protein